MPGPLLFDAVLLDLDGTIVATDQFWLAAARRGARRAFAELGIEREQPSDAAWMSIVGLPLAQGFDALFADLGAAQRAVVLERCIEEETLSLTRVGPSFLPGAEEGLAALAATGAALGIASNCGRGYLEQIAGALGLGRWVSEQRCLDSPGCSDKAAMLQDLLETFGTRSAVMVGDRYTDGEAARENGLPFVLVRSGVAGDDGGHLADGEVADLSELPALFDRRATFIGAALAELGVGRPGGPRALGVTGRMGAGATLFARDAARLLAAAGIDASVVPAPDDWRARGDGPAALLAAVDGATSEVRLVEGPWLLDPRVRMRLDRVVYLEVPDEVRLARVAGRDGRREGPGPVAALRSEVWHAERAFEARCPPAAADLVLSAANVLGP